MNNIKQIILTQLYNIEMDKNKKAVKPPASKPNNQKQEKTNKIDVKKESSSPQKKPVKKVKKKKDAINSNTKGPENAPS